VESDAGGKLMTTISNEKLQEIIELEKRATPLNDSLTVLNKFNHGGARWMKLGETDAVLIADFYNAEDRDYHVIAAESAAAMAAELIELRKEKEKTCEWTYQPDEGYWKTSCGESFFFEEGILKENRAFFCHNCGKKIIETAIDPNGDADDE
jgi:hypothetical protein